MIEPPFGTIEIVHKIDYSPFIKPVVPEPLPDMSPVFLFNMDIIIFVIVARTRKLNWLDSIGKVVQKMIV